jgi:peptide/nickel transport system permease protein
MVPNCAAPYIVFATANLGYAVVVEAALSFLGVGTPPDVPSWGGMLSITGQKYVEVSPWLVIFPSVVVSLTVFGFNLLGDALRDTLDPRLRGDEAAAPSLSRD